MGILKFNVEKMKLLYLCVTFVYFLCLYVSAEGSIAGMRELTIPSTYTHPVCKRNSVTHSKVEHNKSLVGGMEQHNTTMLGDAKDMNDCMALCCARKDCGVAYMKNQTCMGVTCDDYSKCKLGYSNLTAESPANDGIKLALIIRNEANRRVYVTVYLVVVVCAFAAAMMGTVWGAFVFYRQVASNKQYSPVSNSEKEGEKQVENIEFEKVTREETIVKAEQGEK